MSHLLVALPSARDLLDFAEHLFVAAMVQLSCLANWSAVHGPSGWGWPRSTARALITALGPWEPPRGRSNGQFSLLNRDRSGAQRRWVEAHQASAFGVRQAAAVQSSLVRHIPFGRHAISPKRGLQNFGCCPGLDAGQQLAVLRVDRREACRVSRNQMRPRAAHVALFDLGRL